MSIVSKARKLLGKNSRIKQLEGLKFESPESPVKKVFNEYVDVGEHVIEMEEHWVGLLTKIEGEGESNKVQEELLLQNMDEKEEKLENKLESLWKGIEAAKNQGNYSRDRANLVENDIEAMEKRSEKIREVIGQTEQMIEEGNNKGIEKIVEELKKDEESMMKQIVATKEKLD